MGHLLANKSPVAHKATGFFASMPHHLKAGLSADEAIRQNVALRVAAALVGSIKASHSASLLIRLAFLYNGSEGLDSGRHQRRIIVSGKIKSVSFVSPSYRSDQRESVAGWSHLH